jgi:hypothetical protein
MRGKRLSERTMARAKLDMLIDYYLADMQRRVRRCGSSGPSSPEPLPSQRRV